MLVIHIVPLLLLAHVTSSQVKHLYKINRTPSTPRPDSRTSHPTQPSPITAQRSHVYKINKLAVCNTSTVNPIKYIFRHENINNLI